MKIRTKKTLALSALSSLMIGSTLVITSCSTYLDKNTTTLKYANANDPYSATVAANNPTFSDAANSTFFQSIYTSLVSWKTTGEYTFDDKTGDILTDPKSTLVLEAATKLEIKKADGTVSYSLDRATNQDGVIDETNAKAALLQANEIVFTLNKDMKWVDTNGVVKQGLTPKDFLYGLISYFNSSQYGLNSNAYFMTYAGIDYDATTILASNASTTPGETFTFKIGASKSPYFLDLLTKQYFFPVPYSHPEVLPTVDLMLANSPVKTLGKIEDKNLLIDKINTDWNGVFGAGKQQQTNPDAWYAGAYYLNKVSLQDIVFQRNNQFFDANSLVFGTKDTKIEKVVLSYGNTYGNHEKIFRSYTTNDLNYVTVQSEQLVEAYRRYRNTTSFHPIALAKQKKTYLVTYNTQIYDANGNRKSNIDAVYEKFVSKWSSDGLAIRKAINGVINYPKLAEIVWNPGKYDINMSAIPYGNLNYLDNTDPNNPKEISQYQAIADGKINGALGIPFTEMVKSPNFIIDTTATKDLLAKMNLALNNIGATKSSPLRLDYRTLSRTFTIGQVKYNEELKHAIESMSGNRIIFNLIPRTTTSTNDIFYNKNGPMGSFLWSSDYAGAGTFIGYYFALEYDETTGKPKTIIEPAGDINDGLIGPYFTPSLWKPLFDDMFKNTDTTSWLHSLKTHLQTANVFKDATLTKDSFKNVNAGILDKQIGIWSDLLLANASAISQWIDLQYPFIPFVQEGLDYRGLELYPDKFQVVHSLNSDDTYRDFIYDPTKA
ncbi:MAG: MG321/MPN456 family lipoprotein [Malacoplasma sp.]